MNQSTKLTHRHCPKHKLFGNCHIRQTQRTAIAYQPQLKTTNFTVERNFATFRIQPGLKVTYKQNPPTPTSDQIDSLIPTIAETGRIKNKFSKKKKNLEIKRRNDNDEVVQIPQTLRSGSHTEEINNMVQVRIPQRTNKSPIHHLNIHETSQTPIR